MASLALTKKTPFEKIRLYFAKRASVKINSVKNSSSACNPIKKDKDALKDDGFAAGNARSMHHQDQDKIRANTFPAMNKPFSVNRPRTSPLIRSSKFMRNMDSETEIGRKMGMDMQHLQPAMLQEFYKPKAQTEMTPYPEINDKSTQQYRHFEISKTHKSLTKPMKPARLANPFPDPVKIMPSDTVSDQEKAEQMLAESRGFRRS